MSNEPIEPGKVGSRHIYAGHIIDLNIDTVRFPNGAVGELEMIRHSGAAAVLPLVGKADTPDPDVLLIRQYRYATGGYLLEVPAGRPDRKGEDWEVCARRELEEETGIIAGSLRYLTTIFTTPGFTDEQIHLYVATDCHTTGTGKLDHDEFIEPVVLPLSEVLRLVRRREIVDAKSICTILYFAAFRGEEG
jgi:ADP-ribose pyrophosphatase